MSTVDVASETTPPKDRFYLVYILLHLLGISCLLPWNFVITASQYFAYKYRNVSLPLNMSTEAEYATRLQVTFESTYEIASLCSSCTFQVLVILFIRRVSFKARLISALCLAVAVFAVTTILVKVDTDKFQEAFLAATLIMVVLFSGSSAVTESSLFGLTAAMPPKYTQAIMGGMGLAGVVSSLANVLTLAVGANVVDSAFWYFIIAETVILLSLGGFLLIDRLEFTKYYRRQSMRLATEQLSQRQAEGSASPVIKLRIYLCVFKQIRTWAFSVGFSFLVTLAIFPSITVNVHSMNEDSDSIWSTKFFVPLYCFMLFNVGDLLGRILAGLCTVPKPKVTVPVLSLVRVVLIPLFMMCNVRPRSGVLPTVLDNDAYPYVLMALLSLSNGYLTTLSMMLAPSTISKDQTETAGMLMAFFMMSGLAAGSLFSYLLIHLV